MGDEWEKREWLFRKLLSCEAVRDIEVLRALHDNALAYRVHRLFTDQRLGDPAAIAAAFCMLACENQFLLKQLERAMAINPAPIILQCPPGFASPWPPVPARPPVDVPETPPPSVP